MRAILNSQVSFGLVNVPVKIYAATEDHDIKFHQVHAKDGGQIRYRRICEDCGDTVEFRDIAKAYTSEKDDQTIVLTEGDLATIDAGHRPIEVLEFVPAGGIDPLLYDRSYYLGPNIAKSRNQKVANPGAIKAYTLLARVLLATEQIAIVQFTMRSKTRLAALSVTGKQEVLVLHTLQWPDEVREPEFSDLDTKPEVKDIEIDAGIQLVEALSAEGFNPDHYRDTYQEQLQELIDAKLRGEVLETAEASEEAPEDVSDLLAKLQASVKKPISDTQIMQTRTAMKKGRSKASRIENVSSATR